MPEWKNREEGDCMKKFIALALALVCVLGLVSCSDKNMTFDIGEASKINIKNGLTGDEVNIVDTEFIQNITENINSLRFEKTSATDGKVGYVYMLTWFDTEDNQIAKITITEENGYQISHDGYYYKVGADLCIDTALIDEILNISVDTLVSFDFIEPLYDKSGASTCSGYSNVYVTSQGVYEIKPFISCSDYVTSGY